VFAANDGIQPRTLEERRHGGRDGDGADICTVGAGGSGAYPYGFTVRGPYILFGADDCVSGLELWPVPSFYDGGFGSTPGPRSRFWATTPIPSLARPRSISPLPRPARVAVRLYDLSGRLVRTLAEGTGPPASTRLRGVARRTTVAWPRMGSISIGWSRRDSGAVGAWCSCVRVFLRDARGQGEWGEVQTRQGSNSATAGLGPAPARERRALCVIFGGVDSGEPRATRLAHGPGSLVSVLCRFLTAKAALFARDAFRQSRWNCEHRALMRELCHKGRDPLAPLKITVSPVRFWGVAPFRRAKIATRHRQGAESCSSADREPGQVEPG